MAIDIQTFKTQLGQRIRVLRERRGLTQMELGALMDKDFQAISRMEKGRVNPSAYQVYVLAGALGVPIEEFFDMK
ncbi:MAG TPA: helix-turn-helix transcriptional regulator [Parapedobacter sp.]|uniref:helix-turn-helix domain-containing protein n=1 Tax=Parapedobacter sp. TaxID=1958893 RepID=UPI002C74039F|nr:helix-turn-helix transcriptional regulator [Parapedobacter sp.]HWK57130.1 helix-turn-helix transcriptional regulator [Parapedobacter sp.]